MPKISMTKYLIPYWLINGLFRFAIDAVIEAQLMSPSSSSNLVPQAALFCHCSLLLSDVFDP